MPRPCPLCGRIVLLDTDSCVPLTCAGCLELLERWRYASYAVRCAVCGEARLQPAVPCPGCLAAEAGGRTVGRTICCGPYRGDGKTLLISYKFHRRSSLAPIVASLFLLELRELYDGVPVVLMPVPSGRKNRRRRGWDQMELVCRHLREQEDVSVLSVLKRVDDREQKTLDRNQRLQGYESRFSLRKGAERLLLKEIGLNGDVRFIVLDDVYTTGSTVEGCRRLVMDALGDGYVVDALILCKD